MSPTAAQHILVLGGAYAGLAAVMHLQQQFFPDKTPAIEPTPDPIPMITVLDERDGVCRWLRRSKGGVRMLTEVAGRSHRRHTARAHVLEDVAEGVEDV